MEARMKWWGWGEPGKRIDLARKRSLVAFLDGKLGVGREVVSPPVAFDTLAVPATRIGAAERKRLAAVVGEPHYRDDRETRIHHTLGKSYRDLVRIRSGKIPRPPDAVLFPRSAEEVAAILAAAARLNFGVIPFGGGTSVVGGVEPVENGLAAQLALDLTRMEDLLELDETSRTARFQAGILGPALERTLGARGWSLGHYPQSFEFSTLGGWVAARSAGQNSSRYGKIEDMVEAVKLVYPGGVWETRAVPAASSGPEWRELLVGSEGVLGVIVEATVRVHPTPPARDYRGMLFRDFAAGTAAVRAMVQEDVHPAIVRMNDANYTEMAFAFLGAAGGGGGVTAAWGRRVLDEGLRRIGYGVPGACLLLVGFEGSAATVAFQRAQAGRIARRHGALPLGTMPARTWRKERFDHPYLRDEFMERGILIDTLETATNWSNLERLYRAVRGTLDDTLRAECGRALVLCHVSHVYPEGASLYFTFMAPARVGRELEPWQVAKEAASDAIVANGGTISHHHGVGMDHARWMALERGPAAMAALKALKATLDPAGILNPGKLGMGEPKAAKDARGGPRR